MKYVGFKDSSLSSTVLVYGGKQLCAPKRFVHNVVCKSSGLLDLTLYLLWALSEQNDKPRFAAFALGWGDSEPLEEGHFVNEMLTRISSCYFTEQEMFPRDTESSLPTYVINLPDAVSLNETNYPKRKKYFMANSQHYELDTLKTLCRSFCPLAKPDKGFLPTLEDTRRMLRCNFDNIGDLVPDVKEVYHFFVRSTTKC